MLQALAKDSLWLLRREKGEEINTDDKLCSVTGAMQKHLTESPSLAEVMT